MSERAPPGGWTTWHDRPDDIVVLAYRPDVFDGSAFPAPCMPTVAIKPERERGRRGRPRRPRRKGPWCAELTLEPDVLLARRQADDREAAIDAGLALCTAFLEGEIAIREQYEAPHEAYLARLEELLESEG